MRIKFFTILFMILFAGCANKEAQIDINKQNTISKTISSKLNLPNEIKMNDEKFIKKYEINNLAEYYLAGDRVGFLWQKMISVQFSKRLDISKYKETMMAKLADNKLGKAQISLRENGNNEVVGYILLEPDKSFEEIEINLILARQLNCGLAVVSYSFKQPNDDIKKAISNAINKEHILKEIPQISCK